MLTYLTRLAVESLLALSVALTGGPDATDAFETVEQLKQGRTCSVVRSKRTRGE